ncbi:MAG: class I SAM-dependent methyltransferase, partial [Planctomycetota bacterium]
QWGRDNNLSQLSESDQRRITPVQDDVRLRHPTRADVLAAQNFSFWIFKTRQEVVEYFKIARANLKSEGILLLDMMGGPGCYEEQTDQRKIGKGKKSFTYEWEQASFDPITRDASFYIHFEFQDGSRIERAFEYHWRFWTIPEIREMLEEAGFSESHVYWETEYDSGEWERAATAESASVWICYVVGVK